MRRKKRERQGKWDRKVFCVFVCNREIKKTRKTVREKESKSVRETD